jgi:hypothetical protein
VRAARERRVGVRHRGRDPRLPAGDTPDARHSEGNCQSYIEDLKRREGADADQPHRTAYEKAGARVRRARTRPEFALGYERRRRDVLAMPGGGRRTTGRASRT